MQGDFFLAQIDLFCMSHFMRGGGMVKFFLSLVFFLTTLVSGGCSFFEKEAKGVQEAKYDSFDEKIAYHENQIKLYQAAIEREKKKSIQSLQSRNMSEVRRVNDKISLYERKIKENQEAIKELKAQEPAMREK